MSSLTTVEHDQLATVHGGAQLPDLTGAIQAGNSAAPTWTAGGAIIGPGAKAAHSAFTREFKLVPHTKWGVAGAIGMAGAGWLYEAGRNLCGQEGWKWCAPAAKPEK
jgi:hypothetical protein